MGEGRVSVVFVGEEVRGLGLGWRRVERVSKQDVKTKSMENNWWAVLERAVRLKVGP